MHFRKFIQICLIFALVGNLNAQTFTDIAASLGLNDGCGFTMLGGGVSCVDFDGDGFDDISLARGPGNSPAFYNNNGDGTFTELFGFINLTDAVKSIIWFDLDNDGDKDLLITCYDAINRLYENTGGLNMSEITYVSGLSPIPVFNFGASVADFNNDSFLDIYISTRPVVGQNYTNKMFLNNGDKTFTDVSISSGTDDGVKTSFCTAFLDINHNNYPELYVSQDKADANSLYKNNQNGTFTDISAIAGDANKVICSMNVSYADIDNDDDMDIYCTNEAEGNVMLRNNGDETFTDIAGITGTLHNVLSWSAIFEDFDNDKDEDLYVVSQGPIATMPNRYYNNNGFGFFNAPYPNGFPGDTLNSYAASSGDFDNDGLMDIVVNNCFTYSMQLWDNSTSNANNWIKIQLAGLLSNADGVGTWIEVYNNGDKQIRYTHSGINYLGQNTSNYHFGLGTETTVDSICLRWQSGTVDKFYNVPVNATHDYYEGSGASTTLALDYHHFNVEKIDHLKAKVTANFSPSNLPDAVMIERAINGRDFVGIHSISNVQARNWFEDIALFENESYFYRLTMIKDGKISHSDIQHLSFGRKTSVSIFPNPAQEKLFVQSPTVLAKVQLLKPNGQLIWQTNINQKNYQIDLSDVEAGIYLLEMTNLKRETNTEKVIVIK